MLVLIKIQLKCLSLIGEVKLIVNKWFKKDILIIKQGESFKVETNNTYGGVVIHYGTTNNYYLQVLANGSFGYGKPEETKVDFTKPQVISNGSNYMVNNNGSISVFVLYTIP